MLLPLGWARFEQGDGAREKKTKKKKSKEMFKEDKHKKKGKRDHKLDLCMAQPRLRYGAIGRKAMDFTTCDD